MKCVYCQGSDFERKLVEEEFKRDTHVVLVPVEVLVCASCGERYYDRKTMRLLEEWQSKINKNQVRLQAVGQVFKAAS